MITKKVLWFISLILVGFYFQEIATFDSWILDKSTRRLDNLVISINEDVEHKKNILTNLKELIKEASKKLYEATKILTNNGSGLMLGDVYITIPVGWTGVEKVSKLTWHTCSKAAINIKRRETPQDKIVTKQLGKCGEPAEISTFPDDFFEGKLAVKYRKIIQSLVKLRYGVFDEYPYQNLMASYDTDNNRYVFSGCPGSIRYETNLPVQQCTDANDVCTYKIRKGQWHNYSIMADDESPGAWYFCNDGNRKHNKFGNTLQNLKCNEKSVSSVILEHDDFKTENLRHVYYTEPNIILVRKQVPTYCLVVDRSGSMYPHREKLLKYLIKFVKEDVPNGHKLGIVIFNKRASVFKNMTIMSDSVKKQWEKDIKNLIIYGSTNIGDGLLECVKQLGGNILDDNPVNGILILFFGGKKIYNGVSMTYDQVLKRIQKKKIKTSVLLFGDEADSKLNMLVQNVGGKFFNADSYQNMRDIVGKLEATIKDRCDTNNGTRETISKGKNIIQITNEDKKFTYIDKFIGRNTEIKFDFKNYNKLKNYDIYLVNPSNTTQFPIKLYNETTIYGAVQMKAKVTILGKPEPGIYKLCFIPKTNTTRTKDEIQYSKLPNNLQQIFGSINFEVSTNWLFLTNKLSIKNSVRVIVDVNNLIRGQIKTIVLKIIHESKQEEISYEMFDNGIGDDSIPNDGYFTKLLLPFIDLKYIGSYELYVDISIKLEELITRTMFIDKIYVSKDRRQGKERQLIDTIAPAQITQLATQQYNYTHISVTFLASGDNIMQGNVSRYQIQYETSHFKPSNENDLKSSNKSSQRIKYKWPTKPRDIIKKFVKLPSAVTQFLCKETNKKAAVKMNIRGIDDAGNKSPWSPSSVLVL